MPAAARGNGGYQRAGGAIPDGFRADQNGREVGLDDRLPVRSAQLPEDDDWKILVTAGQIIEVRRVRAATPLDYGGREDAIPAASVQVRAVASGAEDAADYQRSLTWSAKYCGTQYEFEFQDAGHSAIRLLQLGLATLAALAAAGAVSWLILR